VSEGSANSPGSWLARALINGMRLVAGERPVPVDLVRGVRKLAGGADPLSVDHGPEPGSSLANPAIAEIVGDREIGTWALGRRTLGWLERQLVARRPRVVLEFGSGVSTVVLAWAMRSFGRDHTRPAIISIEQSADHAKATSELITRSGLDPFVQVIVAPLSAQRIEQVETLCYDLPDLTLVLDGRQIDFVLIDGPAAETGARFGTLPLVRQWLSPNAYFALDDGLRDGELDIASRWTSLEYIQVEGLVLVEKGLVVGHARRA